jgi:CRISPR-associated protein Cmr4
MKIRLYTLRTLSGLHCGIGQGLSDIDLPTARETVTGYPFVPGSTIKGVLRDLRDPGDVNGEERLRFEAAFGKPTTTGNLDFASSLSFSDLRLLCMPVRSYFGTFAHLSSVYSLASLKETLRRVGKTQLPSLPLFPGDTDTYRGAIPSGSKLISDTLKDRLLLEDLDLLVHEEAEEIADAWGKLLADLIYPADVEGNEEARHFFIDRFAIVADDVMAFLCETALPVTARIRIGANGTVESGALWYEEYVPAEAVFYGTIHAEHGKGAGSEFSAQDLLDYACEETIDCQIGGHATIGRGFVTIIFPNEGGKQDAK